MSDLINRADAIEAVCGNCLGEHFTKCNQKEWCEDIKALSALPSADAVSMEEHVKELNDLAVEWKAKFVKAEKITDEIYDETMAKVAKECEVCKERLRNIRPSAEAVQGWIPCSERLPKTCDSVLVTYSDGEVSIIWSARPEAWVRYIESNNLIYPIAWMPLPEPYRKDGE